jgi:hypothetical protein
MKADLYIQLTEQQKEAIRPLVEKAAIAKAEGKLGMIIGQAGPIQDWEDRVYFVFLPNEIASEVQKIVSPKEYERQKDGPP